MKTRLKSVFLLNPVTGLMEEAFESTTYVELNLELFRQRFPEEILLSEYFRELGYSDEFFPAVIYEIAQNEDESIFLTVVTKFGIIDGIPAENLIISEHFWINSWFFASRLKEALNSLLLLCK